MKTVFIYALNEPCAGPDPTAGRTRYVGKADDRQTSERKGFMIRVWNEGSPGGSMWPLPANTWADILSGKITDVSGLFISVETARRLIEEAKMEVHKWYNATDSTPSPPTPEWCGSEGGTPRMKDSRAWVCGEPLSDAELAADAEHRFDAHETPLERAERIAEGIGERKLDQQNDNKP